MKRPFLIKIFAVLLLLATGFPGYAQYTISGLVSNQKGELLSAASIALDKTNDQCYTDSAGNFRLQASAGGKQHLTVSAVGYKLYREEIVLTDTLLRLNIVLILEAHSVGEVIVSAGAFEASDKAKGASLTPIDAATVAGSNGDITQSLRSLPGSQQIGEQEGLFVRGGTSDETKQFIDGTLVKNPNYPGVTGIPQPARINPFLFKGILFNTGGYSALYGQAMSSALILESVDLPEKSSASVYLFPGNMGLGLQSLAKNNRSSFGLNLNYSNQSFYNTIIKPQTDFSKAPEYLEGDANFRIKIGRTGMLKLYTNWNKSEVGIQAPDIDSAGLRSAYEVKGKSSYNNISYRDYLSGNWKAEVGLAYSYNESNTAAGLMNTEDEPVILPQEPYKYKTWRKLIRSDFAQARAVFTHNRSQNQTIRFGFEHFYTHDKGWVGDTAVSLTDNLTAAFAEGDIRLTNNIAVRAGIRAEYAHLLHKVQVAPRIGLAYKLNDGSQFNAAYGIFYQEASPDFLYQDPQLGFSSAAHYILNYVRKANNRFFRVEAYYKKYHNLVKTFPNLATNGKGYAAGFELFWRDKKTFKHLDYWISYTFLDTKRDFLNYPATLKPPFAAPHTATLAIKKFFPAISTNVNFSYAVASGRPYYDNRYSTTDNSYRIFDEGTTKAYSVANLHIAYLTSFFKKWKHKDFSGIAFGVNNLLGTRQVFGYNYSADGNNRVAVTLPATRTLFLGIFMSFGIDRTADFLDKNL